MGKKPPKIEVIGTPRWRGSTLHVRVRFNYPNSTIELGFNIPNSKLQSASRKNQGGQAAPGIRLKNRVLVRLCWSVCLIRASHPCLMP